MKIMCFDHPRFWDDILCLFILGIFMILCSWYYRTGGECITKPQQSDRTRTENETSLKKNPLDILTSSALASVLKERSKEVEISTPIPIVKNRIVGEESCYRLKIGCLREAKKALLPFFDDNNWQALTVASRLQRGERIRGCSPEEIIRIYDILREHDYLIEK